MISQALYLALCNSVSELPLEVEDEYQRFNRPRVLVIHQPTMRGFYLDHQYRHIVDVNNCQKPKNPGEMEKESFCTHSPPTWARAEKSEEFNSFWLY